MRKITIFFIILSISLESTACVRAVRSQDKSVSNPAEISLRSKDRNCDSFLVPTEVALRSWVIESFLKSEKNNKNQVKFTGITSPMLEKVAELMCSCKDHETLLGKDFLDHLDHDLALQEMTGSEQIELFQAFSFLEFEPGTQLLARSITECPEASACVEIEIADKKIENAGCLEFARFYFLTNGRNCSCIDENTYGFSVREYLDYQPEIVKGRWRVSDEKGITNNNQLILTNTRLKDLDGLQEIKELEEVHQLYLNKNQIEQIPAHIMQRAKQLWFLDLRSNPIREFQPDLLSILPQLRIIRFNKDQISPKNKEQLLQILSKRHGYISEKE